MRGDEVQASIQPLLSLYSAFLFQINPMKNPFLLIVFFFFVQHSSAQNTNLQLSKGKWNFCVLDTVLTDSQCEDPMFTYKFKRSGKFVISGFEMFLNGKTIRQQSGRWELNGKSLKLTFDPLSGGNSVEKPMEITILDQNTFYSPQPDARIVYWLFKR